MTRDELRERLLRWLRSLGQSTIVIYELRADWRLLSALFDDRQNQFGIEGRQIAWRDSKWEQRFEELTAAWFEARPVRHHALADARATRESVFAVERGFSCRMGRA